MLNLFRKNTKIIIWITVAALALLFGAGSIVDLVNSKKSGRFAGEVFNHSVTFQEFNRFSRATQLFMPSEKPIDDPDLLRTYTWQNIIYSREAKREGIKVDDNEVREEVSTILKQQGLLNPTPEQYQIWLTRALHMSPREFEEGLREFIRIQKLLRSKIASLAAAETGKTLDDKAKADATAKQKEAFMKWTRELNQKAGLKDYLALSKVDEEELPLPVPPPSKTQAPSK